MEVFILDKDKKEVIRLSTDEPDEITQAKIESIEALRKANVDKVEISLEDSATLDDLNEVFNGGEAIGIVKRQTIYLK